MRRGARILEAIERSGNAAYDRGGKSLRPVSETFMSVTNFPQRRRRSVVASCPPFTRLIPTRDVEVTDETGQILIRQAGELAVTGLAFALTKRVRLLGKDYDAVNVDLPFEERPGD
jgi:hypothetical protein